MINLSLRSMTSTAAAALLLCTLSACSALQPANVPPSSIYTLDEAATRLSSTTPAPVAANAPSIIVSTPHADAGFDSAQMIYVRTAHQLEYFRESQWIKPPAAMLPPLVVAALEGSGSFKAVMQAPSIANADYRLDLEVKRLQQEFFSSPSQIHFTLRAYLSTATSRDIVAWREFDIRIAAPSDDPYGGVVASNQAVQKVVADLAVFCSEAVAGRSKK
ncbi:ABC-type transport auxiliary lipoprotein family protein [Undibacterium sp. TJN19]|uniref:ABC-type transport auxiliary lipoprotein family protein n=1 Tax=Undibacterium sp. TJN19 TaxID=3413055 RepID=UPI003BF183A5